MIFAVYNKTTRELLRAGQCAPNAFAAQATAAHEAVVELPRLPNPLRAYVLTQEGELVDMGLSHLGWMRGKES